MFKVASCRHTFNRLGGKCIHCGCNQREIVFGPQDEELSLEQINKITKRILDERKQKMNPTRCKMKLQSISESYSNGLAIKFTPVTGGSEENKKFYAATPGGSFEFTVSEQASKSLGLDVAKIGTEFYIDITPAN